jgi:murein DD-endopeptidase MepM/ murein hydrolase activator NlpD
VDRYYTLLIVPEREKKVRSIRIPRVTFLSAAFLVGVGLLFLGILIFNYIQILGQISENRHLTLENKQLKEQVQLFQMKVNGLTDDIQRIYTFEKKLRVITGVPSLDKETRSGQNNQENQVLPTTSSLPAPSLPTLEEEEVVVTSTQVNDEFELKFDFEKMTESTEYLDLKKSYEQSIASNFGIRPHYTYTRELNDLYKQSLDLAKDFSKFDFMYKKVKSEIQKLEINIHNLDEFLLDRDSFLKSTPTIIPSSGWVTSYYGPRKSPYSGRLKMHEGIDIGAKPGTDIIAPADGIVTFSGEKPGFGKFVQIDHGYGIETLFGHAQTILAKKGDKITRGMQIAKVGNTGLSTGPHLHYEIRVNGIAVDPLYYMLD